MTPFYQASGGSKRIQGTASRPPTIATGRGRACPTLVDEYLGTGAGRSGDSGRDARATSYVAPPHRQLRQEAAHEPIIDSSTQQASHTGSKDVNPPLVAARAGKCDPPPTCDAHGFPLPDQNWDQLQILSRKVRREAIA